jgi:hypothetical protein
MNLENAYNFRIQCEITDSKLRYEIGFLEDQKGSIPQGINFETIKVKNEHEEVEESTVVEVLFHEEEVHSDDDEYQEMSVEMEIPSKTEEEVESDDEVLEAEYLQEESDEGEMSECDDELIDSKSPKKRVKAVTNDDRKYECVTCNEEFQRASDLYTHTRSVHGKNKFQCKECLKWFSRKSRLESHELLHKGVRLFECDQCPRKYATPQGLKTHLDDAHSVDYPYVCDKCGKGFIKESKLKHHYSSHIEVRNYACEICHKSFKTQTYLNFHMDTHQPPELRKHKRRPKKKKTCICPYCGKVSTSLGTHSMHLR